ncbi:16S rRNA (cytosine(1402)-N(4))-methyltransferase [Candidatus Peregrinibacteria bacterium CG_4_9_14_0_2_um_filter_41_14]|nr:MAG: 16S rRNA (cytosine(1402)-N(4))-methyltransferase [Candidatus Peregrinibacteria bacterium CG_4_10_14_0_2_um_filter_41_8]PJC38163.1 MAG: 16S rRNA (cytosine(1402)-N(4))-methyltransferase [Candidatus Peregrinibacteria bacterium CG_4_9_14_0_2_um_filter_41_14]
MHKFYTKQPLIMPTTPSAPSNHEPVLLDKVVELLEIKSGDVVVDGTLGLGGHAKRFAELVGEEGRVVGFDLDGANLQLAQRNLRKFEGRVTFVNDSYDKIDHYLKALKLPPYNKVLLDLGVSSPHFDDAERGFSFRKAGPLDMRFDKRLNVTAEKILHKATQEQLENILRNFGEVANFRKTARKIVEERNAKRFTSTTNFVTRIESVLPKQTQNKVLAQIFQALRIAVNDELNVLQRGVHNLWTNLSVNGFIAIISYHSLEDRLVKQYFAPKLKSCICPSSLLKCECRAKPEAFAVTKRVVVPTKEEEDANPRSRSAKLRVYQKLM